QFAEHGVAHVTGARDNANTARGFLAMLPTVDHQVPDDLVQVAAIEEDHQVAGNLDHHGASRHLLGLDDFIDQRLHELTEGDHFGVLPVASIELQNFADD